MGKQGVRVNVDLDFTSGNIDKEGINKQINSAIEAVKINLDPQSAKEFENELKQLGGMLQRHLNEATGKINAKGLVAEIDNTENFRMVEELGNRYAEVGVHGQQSFKKIAQESDYLNKSLGTSSNVLEKMGNTLMNTVRWNISASVVNAVTGEFQQMYYYAKDLDRVMTDISIVTGHSANKMAEFAVEANQAAKELKVSTLDYADAATLFYQQGFNDSDVKNMAEAAVIASNITGTAAEEMSDLLTSTLNGYRMGTDEILKITDKFAGVGAETASDFYELSTAMSKVASMANTAGVPIDELTGQLATIISVTRDAPETVGTALKTIYGRMLAFKADSDAILEDEDGEMFSAPAVEKALEAYNKMTGAQISLFETAQDGTKVLRNQGDVINDIGNSWDKTEDKVAKFGLTTALAGTRQQNNLIALFDNWDMYQDAVTTALESEGTSMEQNATYMESYEGKIKGLQASKEGLYMSLTDSDSMKSFIDVLTKGVDLVTVISEQMGGINAIIGLIGVAFSKNILQGLDRVKSSFTEMMNASSQGVQIETLNKLKDISKVLGEETANSLRDEHRQRLAVLKLTKREKDVLNEKVAELEKGNIKKNEEYSITKRINDLEVGRRELKDRGVETTELDLMLGKYEELKAASRELRELNTQAAEGAGSSALDESIMTAENRVKALENEIKSIYEIARSAEETSEASHMHASAQVEKSSKAINEAADEAGNLTNRTRDLNTVLTTLPGVLRAVNNDSSTWLEFMRDLGTAAIPTVIRALGPMTAAFAAATTEGAGLIAALSAAGAAAAPFMIVAGAVGALGLALRAVKQDAMEAEIAMNKLEEASSEAATAEQKYEGLRSEIKRVKEELEEVNKLADSPSITSENAENARKASSELERQLRLLEQEEVVQKALTEEARKQAEQAAQEAASAKITSQYKKDYDSFSGAAMSSKVTMDEEVRLATESLEENSKAIDENIKALNERNREITNGVISEKINEGQKKNLLKTIENLREAKEKDIKVLTDQAAALSKIVGDLDENDEANKKLIDSYNDLIELLDELNGKEVNIDFQVGDGENGGTGIEAIDKLIEDGELVEFALLAQKGAIEELVEEYEILQEAMAMIQDEGHLNLDMYDKLSDMSEEFAGIMGLEADEAFNLLLAHATKAEATIDNAIAQESTVLEGIASERAAMAEHIRDLQNMANIVKSLFGNIKSAQPLVSKFESAVPKTFSKEWGIANGIAGITETERKLDEQLGRLRAGRNTMNQARKRSVNRGSSKKKGGGGSKKKGGGGSSSKSAAKEKLVEADAYETLNRALEENNALIAMNNARRDMLVETDRAVLKSKWDEIALQEDRQKLLNLKNQQLREEGKKLQSELSGIFDFEGSWGDNSIMITNLEAIDGKSEETGEKFNRILEIMKALPEGSQDWWKIQKSIEDLKIERMVFHFEELNRALDHFDNNIVELDRDLQIKGPEDFSNQVENLNGKIDNMDRLTKMAEYRLNNLQDSFKTGSIGAAEFVKQQKQLNERFREGQVALAQYKRELENLIDAERERQKEAHIKTLNDALQEERDQIDAVQEAQDIIVQIIQKRGEKEREILDRNHREALDRLEKERRAQQKKYDEDLDAYRKLINDKLAALDEQYAEEDYQEQLLKEQNEANRLQQEIDKLSLDDSLMAKNKRAELREELAKQIEKIEKMQQKKSRDSQKKALQDELKDYENQMKDKDDIAEDSYNKERERLEEEYQRDVEHHEKMYSNAKVYAEAADALVAGRVKGINGAYQTIGDAHRTFQEEFGEGMGILGKIIQDDFISQLESAGRAIDRLGRYGFNKRPRDDWSMDDDDSEMGFEFDRPQGQESGYDPQRRPREFMQWDDDDYQEYIDNKMKWDNASTQERKRLKERNRQLRRDYWGVGRENEDKFTWEQLMSFKDGGVMDETGLFVGHGSENSSEVVFSAKTAKKLWEYVEKMPDLSSNFKAPTPKNYDTIINSAGNNYNINFDVQGNLDSDLLPEIEKKITVAIEKAEFQKKKELNKLGQFRSV